MEIMTNFLDERTPEEISQIQVILINERLKMQGIRPLRKVTPILDLLRGKK